MDYYINPAMLSSAFTVPSAVVDKYLKFANAEHIKILLYVMRNMSGDIPYADIASECAVSEYDVKEALLYWADCGILMPKETVAKAKKSAKKVIERAEKPTRNDVAQRGAQDAKIRYLLHETQLKFGRNLKSNEAATLVWLYDDEGMDISLILLIVTFAAAHNKTNIRFIESTAVDWLNRGISDIDTADEELRKMAVAEQAWGIVSRVFGIEKRKPSKKEEQLVFMWIEEWKLSKEMLGAAYEECVNQKSKFIFSYVAKILENWHQKGYKNPSDIEKGKGEAKTGAAYDMDLFEKMLHSKD